MSSRVRAIWQLCIGVVLFAAAGTSHAAFQTIPGTNFDLLYDDALYPGGVMGLFGVPTLSGNNVIFTPIGFDAQSVDGAGTVITNQTINFRLQAKNDFAFTEMVLFERGDYKLDGAGSSVDIDGQITVFDVNDPLDPFLAVPEFLSTSSDLTINDNQLHPWLASATTNSGAWTTNGPNLLVNVTFENILTAYTNTPLPDGSTAFVEKKFAGGSVVLTVVPEPMAMWLVGTGLLGVIGFARRRR